MCQSGSSHRSGRHKLALTTVVKPRSIERRSACSTGSTDCLLSAAFLDRGRAATRTVPGSASFDVATRSERPLSNASRKQSPSVTSLPVARSLIARSPRLCCGFSRGLNGG